MMDRHDWDLLLERYISGECSAAEEAAVRQELAERGGIAAINALRAARARTVEGARTPPAGPATSADVTEALARLDARLVDAGLRPAPTPRLRLRLAGAAAQPNRGLAVTYGLRAASVTLLLLGGAAGAWLVGRRAERDQPMAVSTAAMREFATTRGQRAIFQLIDGTQVVLGVDSRLRMPKGYGAQRRDVYLDGEAYFTVTHDAARPFVVHTARGVTRDIGTKFGVRAYRNAAAERVVVAEGAVAVAAGEGRSGERLLEAGQLAVVSPAGTLEVVDRVDIAHELAWIEGRLLFRNTPLGEVQQDLSRWYDVDIRLADPTLAERPVSGVYAGEPLDQVLTLITAATGARFQRRDKTVIIFPKTGGLRP